MKATCSSLAVIASVVLTLAPDASAERRPSANAYAEMIRTLKPLHNPLGAPGPSDWLAQHKEPGQSFAQYLRSRPVTPRGQRNRIYIQPIGAFTETETRIVTLTAEYMHLYFGVQVKSLKAIPLTAIPKHAQRVHPTWGDRQILTDHVLHTVLKPKLPNDAAALLALTSSDLWPGKNWNFVFGQASLRERVGVWSIYRNGDPDKGEEAFRLCLKRTIKTAVHETGHMFTLWHCTAYECIMCGSNHREESDRRPVYLCPECLAKVCWATGTDPVKRYTSLKAFCDRNGFSDESAFFETSITLLTTNRSAPKH